MKLSIKLLCLPLLFGSLLSAEALSARAVIVSLDKTTLSSEIAGEIIYLSKNEGDYFKRGESLVRLDCSVYEAQKRKIDVEKKIAKLELEKNKKLDEYGSIGTFEIQISQENFNMHQVESSIAQINISRCNIKAPFNGRIASKKAAKYQNVKPQDELLEIVSTDNLEARVVVPSAWLSWLKKGQELELHIDETQSKVKAKIVQIDAIVDPTSQSVSLRAKLHKAPRNILPGMSATAAFNR